MSGSGWTVLVTNVPSPFMAAIFNLNHPAHMISVWVVHITVANFIVILLMFIAFAAAILVPFPHHDDGGSSS